LSKSNSRTFKDFQGPYEGYIRRTQLNQTGTFICIYKQVQFTFDNLTPVSINQKLELSEKNSLNASIVVGHGVLENQIQTLSRTFRHRFKDFQGLSRTRKSPVMSHVHRVSKKQSKLFLSEL